MKSASKPLLLLARQQSFGGLGVSHKWRFLKKAHHPDKTQSKNHPLLMALFGHSSQS